MKDEGRRTNDPASYTLHPSSFVFAFLTALRGSDRFVIAFFGGSVADQVFALGQQALVAALQRDPAFAGHHIVRTAHADTCYHFDQRGAELVAEAAIIERTR